MNTISYTHTHGSEQEPARQMAAATVAAIVAVAAAPAPRLDAAALQRSLESAPAGFELLGSAASFVPLFGRLDSGAPITLGVFGASVAQNGGCLDQPYKRCNRYDGVHSALIRWGAPRMRPFKGFAVRLLDAINASWPHGGHP